MNFAKLKNHGAANAPVYVLVFAYFVTTILANILYLTPLARDWPAMSIPDFSWTSFRSPLGFEFWALALMLPVVAPIVAVLVRKAMAPLANVVSPAIPELTKASYFVLCAALYAYAFSELYRAHAWQMLISGGDQTGAVEARFAVLAELGFLPRVVLQSLLVFLAVYAIVRASREGGAFWRLFVLWHVFAISIGLILLNMKWPVVVFVVTLGLAFFVTAKKFPVAKSGAVMIVGICIYLFMSAVLLRIPAGDDSSAKVLPRQHGIEIGRDYAVDAMGAGVNHAPHLLAVALNRMAISVPYYFDIFKVNGPVCGTYEDRIMKRPIACEPTNLVYTSMFGHDGFEGRGTAPAAPNLTGFALDGWAGAWVCTLLTGVVLGLFLALWPSAATSPMYMTAFIMGGYTAYFFSQLPFEGPIIYDHGMLWWVALVLAWTTIYWCIQLFTHWTGVRCSGMGRDNLLDL